MGNLDNEFIVIKDGKYKVLDIKSRVMHECETKKRAFELARQLNEKLHN